MAMTAKQTGQDAEELACRYLLGHGLRLLERNFRCTRGELDLIMEDGETLVFIEVRFRKQGRFGSGAESIQSHKQSKIITTALYYLQGHPKYQNRPSRFDVVAISNQLRPEAVEWIKDAFQV